MAHITLPEGLPGITGPFAFRPETAKPMRELAEILLRGPNSLSSADREIIARSATARLRFTTWVAISMATLRSLPRSNATLNRHRSLRSSRLC